MTFEFWVNSNVYGDGAGDGDGDGMGGARTPARKCSSEK